MTPLEAPPSTRSFALQPQQALHLRVRAGSFVLVQGGAVRLQEAPRWLAESVFRPASRLSEGAALCIAQGGWLELAAAEGAAQVLLFEPVPAWRRLLARWGRVGRVGRSAVARPPLAARLTRPS